jgi:nickel/cobalt exporter
VRISTLGRAASAALLVLGALWPGGLAAHELTQGVGTQSTFHLFPDRLEIELNLGFSASAGFPVLMALDADGDDRISPEEAERLLAERGPALLALLEIRVNGRPVEARIVSGEEVGVRGTIGVRSFDTYFQLVAPIPPELPTGGWWLHYRDHTFEGETSSQYCWVPYTGHGAGSSWIFRPDLFAEQDIGFRTIGRELVLFFDDDFRPEIDPKRTDPPSIEALAAIALPGELAGGAPPIAPTPDGAASARAPVAPPVAAQRADGPGEVERFGEMVRSIAKGERRGWELILALLLAVGFGAGHALGPGHGKSMVAAYLVGSKGRVRDALVLGGVVTFAHTFSIYLLGLLLLWLIERSADKATGATYQNWLTTAFSMLSGALLLAFGATLFRRRLRVARGSAEAGDHHHHHGLFGHSHPHLGGHSHDHPHSHHHDHGDPHEHSHEPPHGIGAGVRLGDLLALGFSGGIVPCPAGFTIILVAAHYQALALGLVILGFFSLGLGALLCGIGIALVLGKEWILDRFGARRLGFARWLPVASAALVASIGVYFMWDSWSRGRVEIGQMLRALGDKLAG